MNNIVFENVGKTFGKNVIIKDLNLEIKEGERIILLGPSGCGKTTTLRMIAGLESLTTGSLYMGGKKVNDVESGDRDVAMVFQNYALYPHMTVEDNITYGLRIHKLPKNEISQRTKDVITMLDLKGLENRKPKDLSGGQRQRVALARAIVKRTDYFLLDEPLSNLDAQLRVHSRKELVILHEKYKQTFVYVTHDQIEAMTIGNRIVLMRNGEIQMIDTPSNIYSKPANVFTAQFIGSPSMNIFKAVYCEGIIRVANQSIEPPQEWKEKIELSKIENIYFGIRPEYVKLSTTVEDNSLVGITKYSENYGNEVGVFIDINGIEIIAICKSNIPNKGEKVYFRPDYTKVNIFDLVTTKSIGHPE